MQRRTKTIWSVGLSITLSAAIGFAEDAANVPVRKSKQEVAVQRDGIEKALSKEMPQVVKDLPLFGTIEWTVKQLPFVEKGPKGGISGMGMVASGGQIYLMGGFIPAGDGTTDLGRKTSRWTYRYDPKSERWTRLLDLPARREYLRAIAAENAIYALGGAIQGKPYVPSDDVFRLDLSQNPLHWERFSPLTVPRTHMAVGAIGSYLIVAGGNRYDFDQKGYSSETIQGVTDVLDLTKPGDGWRQRASIPGEPRGWAAAAALEGKLFVFGGLTFVKQDNETSGSKAIRIRESLSYDPRRNQWTRLTDPPIAISGWQGAVFENRYVIIVGGVSTLWNDVAFVYDTRTDRWLRIDGPLPPGALFNDPGICILGNTIYVAGSEGPGGSHFNYFLVGQFRVNTKAR